MSDDPKPAPTLADRLFRLIDADGDGAITISDAQRWFLVIGMVRLLWTGGIAGAIEAIQHAPAAPASAPVVAPVPAPEAPPAPADTDPNPPAHAG